MPKLKATTDPKKIVVLVEFEDGSVHQVLTSKENRHLLIDLLIRMDNGLLMSDRLKPVTFEVELKP